MALMGGTSPGLVAEINCAGVDQPSSEFSPHPRRIQSEEILFDMKSPGQMNDQDKLRNQVFVIRRSFYLA